MKTFLLLIFSLLLFSCKVDKDKKDPQSPKGATVEIKYAKGFSIEKYDGYDFLIIKDPWPDADKTYRYLLLKEGTTAPANLAYDQIIQVPVKKLVVTSTTHIPSLEALGVEKTLIGFPGLDYVSSDSIRKLINKGEITELGQNEAINTELLISLEPELVVGFAVNGNNKTYSTIERTGIPVIYNGDWTENSPLGKAEWVKFFGALYNKNEEASRYFKKVETNYKMAKNLAATAEKKPTVLSGSMYKDQWYVPYGNSWLARFIEEANASYIYKETTGSGSMALAFETVLSDAQNVDYWVAPGQFGSYVQLMEASPHYDQFKAVKEQKVYTYSSTKGETGGALFFELAPNRPDLVLRDLIAIFHPQLLPQHQFTFFKPLQ
ncbi:ABC transporter substrate-binding protein [Antarcticibacterium sp. W02-3]|uniref:ABC transporter substrate-binding protein n=1 Tax=Antarcticibacterium sp. W02-3 TaxID=2183747 RepID=UPI0020449CD0|nr:ABC transporter substrate-binding protein [Antarcticibacterium sp. W02-3]MCM4160367.1 ABC transporter substrate-binding protein [Antarcticibacterium sp. W02-3]